MANKSQSFAPNRGTIGPGQTALAQAGLLVAAGMQFDRRGQDRQPRRKGLNQDGQPTLWQRLIGPSPRIQGDEQCAAARLMAVLMLAHVAAVVLGLVLSDLFWRRTLGTSILRDWDVFGIIAGAVLIAVSFLVVRAGRYRAGVALYLACTTAVPLTVPFLGSVQYEIALLASGIIPVLIAAIALSHRWVLGVLASIVGIGMVELLVFPIPPRLATTGFEMLIVVLVSGVLVLVLRRQQARASRIRLQAMHANEDAARRSERHYRTLFETVTDGIFLVRRDEKLIEVNNAACRELGYTREELLGMPLGEIVAPEAREQLPKVQREVISKGFVRVEGAQRRKDGSTYPVDLAVSMTELDGAPAFMGVARDISERMRAEADSSPPGGPTPARGEDGIHWPAGRRCGPRFQQPAHCHPGQRRDCQPSPAAQRGHPGSAGRGARGRHERGRADPATAGLLAPADRGAASGGPERADRAACTRCWCA